MKEEEYTGVLPKHVLAQIQEHTAGGFILFRISGQGEVITDLEFDDEVSYHALVRKAAATVTALNKVDDIKTFQSFSMGLEGIEDLMEGDFGDEEFI